MTVAKAEGSAGLAGLEELAVVLAQAPGRERRNPHVQIPEWRRLAPRRERNARCRLLRIPRYRCCTRRPERGQSMRNQASPRTAARTHSRCRGSKRNGALPLGLSWSATDWCQWRPCRTRLPGTRSAPSRAVVTAATMAAATEVVPSAAMVATVVTAAAYHHS